MQPKIGDKVTVVMDRPMGSKHPEHGFIYPINYGYIPDTKATDGEEMDAYVVGEYEPLTTYEGYIIAVIKRKDDIEDKFVVCKEMNQFTESQIEALVKFQERFFDSTIIMVNNKDELSSRSSSIVNAVGSVLLCIIFIVAIIRKEHPYNIATVLWTTWAVEKYYMYKENKCKKIDFILLAIAAIGCTIIYISELFGV